MKEKNIYFHIGPGKTGTSAIQAWLQSNQAWLKKNNVLYPEHELDINNVSSGNLLQIVDRDKEGKTSFSLSKKEQLQAKLDRSNAETLLISSEFLFSHADELLEHFPQSKVVIYLRDPIELLESNYNQSVKRHGVFIPLNGQPQGFPTLPYLERLLKKHGKSRVIIRPYHVSEYKGGNIISDLLYTVGVNTAPSLNDSRINSSYQFEALEFKRLANYFPISQLEADLDKVLQRFSSGISKYTLLDEEFESDVRASLSNELNIFIEKFDLHELKSFNSKLRDISDKPRLYQQATVEQLMSVATYLKNTDPKLFDKLSNIVASYNHFYLDTPEFRGCFTLDEHQAESKNKDLGWVTKALPFLQSNKTSSPKKSKVPLKLNSINLFKKRLNLPPHMKNERVLINIAMFAFEQEEYAFAERLMMTVLELSPHNPAALQNINKVKDKLHQ